MILTKIANIFRNDSKILLGKNHVLIKCGDKWGIRKVCSDEWLDLYSSIYWYGVDIFKDKYCISTVEAVLNNAVKSDIIDIEYKNYIINKHNLLKNNKLFKLTDEEKNDGCHVETLYMKLNKGVSIVQFPTGYAVKLNDVQYLDLYGDNSVLDGYCRFCVSNDLSHIRNHIKKYDKGILL